MLRRHLATVFALRIHEFIEEFLKRCAGRQLRHRRCALLLGRHIGGRGDIYHRIHHLFSKARERFRPPREGGRDNTYR